VLRLSRGSMASQLLRRAGARALPVAWRFHVSRALIWWRNPACLCWTCPATAPDGVPARADNRADGRDNQKHNAPTLNAERALPAQ